MYVNKDVDETLQFRRHVGYCCQYGNVHILHRAISVLVLFKLCFLLQVGEGGREDEVEDPPEGRCEGDALGQCPARHQFQGAANRYGGE